MRRFEMMGLCVAAMAVLCAAMTASASAAVPTWFECAKAPKVGRTHTGNYNDKRCTSANESGDGRYVLREGVGHIKSSRGKGGPAVLNVKTYLGDSTVECASSQERATPQLPNLVVGAEVVLKKCTTSATGSVERCSSVGRKRGEIKLHALRGELGYLSESPLVVGLKLALESEPGGAIANFTCGPLEVTVAGSIVGVQGQDVNAVDNESETVYEASELLGEIEFEGHRFAPLVNLLGFADELEAIAKLEAPPNVLTTTICGTPIEVLLGKPCTPQALAGEDETVHFKGEPLMIKA